MEETKQRTKKNKTQSQQDILKQDAYIYIKLNGKRRRKKIDTISTRHLK